MPHGPVLPVALVTSGTSTKTEFWKRGRDKGVRKDEERCACITAFHPYNFYLTAFL